MRAVDDGDVATRDTDLSAWIEPDGGGMRVVFAGRLDIASAGIARRVLQSLQHRPMDVRLDLSRVAAVDAAGLGVLVAGVRRADATGGSLTVAGASEPIHRALRMAGLTSVLHATVTDG